MIRLQLRSSGDCAPNTNAQLQRVGKLADMKSAAGADFDFFVYAPRSAVGIKPPEHFRGLSARTAAASGLLLDYDGAESIPTDAGARQQLGYVLHTSLRPHLTITPLHLPVVRCCVTSCTTHLQSGCTPAYWLLCSTIVACGVAQVRPLVWAWAAIERSGQGVVASHG